MLDTKLLEHLKYLRRIQGAAVRHGLSARLFMKYGNVQKARAEAITAVSHAKQLVKEGVQSTF